MRRRWLTVIASLAMGATACGSDAEPGPEAAGTGGQIGIGGSGGTAGSGGKGTVAGSGGGVGSGAGGAGAGGAGAGGAGAGGAGAGGGGGVGAGGSGAGSGMSDAGAANALEPFSFFMTSLAGMQRLADDPLGFGGDLTYGQADGLSGADKICEDLAEASMPGSAVKQWRAFLSVKAGPNGKQVDAITRVGEGPWYDRKGRLVAMTKDALLSERPEGADPAIIEDLPNEDGVPNKQPDPTMDPVDNHHVLTGSDAQGKLYGATATCDDWTSTDKASGRPRVGFSFTAGGRVHWISGQDEGGCGAGVAIEENGGSDPNNPIVGSGGGYGAIYCFALSP